MLGAREQTERRHFFSRWREEMVLFGVRGTKGFRGYSLRLVSAGSGQGKGSRGSFDPREGNLCFVAGKRGERRRNGVKGIEERARVTWTWFDVGEKISLRPGILEKMGHKILGGSERARTVSCYRADRRATTPSRLPRPSRPALVPFFLPLCPSLPSVLSPLWTEQQAGRRVAGWQGGRVAGGWKREEAEATRFPALTDQPLLRHLYPSPISFYPTQPSAAPPSSLSLSLFPPGSFSLCLTLNLTLAPRPSPRPRTRPHPHPHPRAHRPHPRPLPFARHSRHSL